MTVAGPDGIEPREDAAARRSGKSQHLVMRTNTWKAVNRRGRDWCKEKEENDKKDIKRKNVRIRAHSHYYNYTDYDNRKFN